MAWPGADPASIIFTEAGARAFVEAWNRSDSAGRLAGLGAVRFEANDDPPAAIHLIWDGAGMVGIGTPGQESIAFSGSREAWNAFLLGRISASAAVISGKLRFAGSLGDVLRYSSAFNCIAGVARGVAGGALA